MIKKSYSSKQLEHLKNKLFFGLIFKGEVVVGVDFLNPFSNQVIKKSLNSKQHLCKNELLLKSCKLRSNSFFIFLFDESFQFDAHVSLLQKVHLTILLQSFLLVRFRLLENQKLKYLYCYVL